MHKYKYLFGPVPSRRFGRSLGVDLTPFKTCSLNCIFCQLGRSENTAAGRKEYVPVKEVIAELEHWLKHDGQADFITLSGSGEPTLNSGFGDILAFIKDNTEVPSLLMTNGTMLHLPEVRKAAALASVVKISMGAWDQDSFEKLNRPDSAVSFDDLLQGEKDFRKEFDGELRLEVFVVDGVNSDPDDMRKIAAYVKEVAPDKVQLNTAVRPAAEDNAVAVGPEKLNELALLFDPPAEVIASFKKVHIEGSDVDAAKILDILRRRPCTAMQLADVLGVHINEISKYLPELLTAGSIHRENRGDDVFFVAS